MRRIVLALAACAALAATAPAAGALELASGWLTSETGEELRCRVVNVGKKPATVLVVLVDNNGASIADITFPGCDGTPLAPNALLQRGRPRDELGVLPDHDEQQADPRRAHHLARVRRQRHRRAPGHEVGTSRPPAGPPPVRATR